MSVVTRLLRQCNGRCTRALSSTQSQCAVSSTQEAYLNEMCIAVDTNDRPIRSVSKREGHRKETMLLHRAFSVFLFTANERLVLQKRSASKITFPSVWTNSCCSHPLWNPHEMPVNDSALGVCRAAQRKLTHELGIPPLPIHNMNVMGRFIYKAMSDGDWGEHELDYVIVVPNFDPAELRPNSDEVEQTAVVDREQLKAMIASDATFSPWFKLLVQGSHLNSWWDNLDRIPDLRDLSPIRFLN